MKASLQKLLHVFTAQHMAPGHTITPIKVVRLLHHTNFPAFENVFFSSSSILLNLSLIIALEDYAVVGLFLRSRLSYRCK